MTSAALQCLRSQLGEYKGGRYACIDALKGLIAVIELQEADKYRNGWNDAQSSEGQP